MSVARTVYLKEAHLVVYLVAQLADLWVACSVVHLEYLTVKSLVVPMAVLMAVSMVVQKELVLVIPWGKRRVLLRGFLRAGLTDHLMGSTKVGQMVNRKEHLMENSTAGQMAELMALRMVA